MSPVLQSGQYVIAFTSGKVYSGALNDEDGMAQIGTLGFTGTTIGSVAMKDPIAGHTMLYSIDGTQELVVDVLGANVLNWRDRVATIGKGTLPEQCQLITRYLGRVVLARPQDNVEIFYLSRIANPLDWDFGADPVATTAIAGTDPSIGAPADAIRALITTGDDYLLFGCQSSLYVLVGDPAYGGRVFHKTDRTGVVGPHAWAYDEHQRLFFLGNGGLYTMAGPNDMPENISGRRMRGILDRVDLEDVKIHVRYEAFRKELHIYMTPDDESTGTHVIYSIPDNAFFLDEYQTGHQPTAAVELDGAEDNDRRIMIGGTDGYVRRWDDDETGDDNEEIDSWYQSGPIEGKNGGVEVLLEEIHGFPGSGTAATQILNDDSSKVDYYWFVADTPQELLNFGWDDAVTTGTLFASDAYDAAIGIRRAGGAHMVRVRQTSKTSTWSLERLTARFKEKGRRR